MDCEVLFMPKKKKKERKPKITFQIHVRVKYTIKLAMLQGDDSRVEIQELHELIQQTIMII